MHGLPRRAVRPRLVLGHSMSVLPTWLDICSRRDRLQPSALLGRPDARPFVYCVQRGYGISLCVYVQYRVRAFGLPRLWSGRGVYWRELPRISLHCWACPRKLTNSMLWRDIRGVHVHLQLWICPPRVASMWQRWVIRWRSVHRLCRWIRKPRFDRVRAVRQWLTT